MTPIPTKDQIRQWITDNPTLSAKRDIAKAFGIKGDARIDLKRILRELEDEGVVEKKARAYREPGALPPVAVLEVIGAGRRRRSDGAAAGGRGRYLVPHPDRAGQGRSGAGGGQPDSGAADPRRRAGFRL